jgi:hypothetical protein
LTNQHSRAPIRVAISTCADVTRYSSARVS